ncbi:hypothetical protein KP806_11825 [Paenibacillus sp. N4]|uniref:hypothetical protein n=1 Tax=Paenibacillus vietnamensis TaxID=2590547 RepID=UPI001CD16C05|nr:hypothetical protein [Paenibacillus vietnamensis]MCA0755737.1 hypothetical protein [Paenibacillus vietnamensis]
MAAKDKPAPAEQPVLDISNVPQQLELPSQRQFECSSASASFSQPAQIKRFVSSAVSILPSSYMRSTSSAQEIDKGTPRYTEKPGSPHLHPPPILPRPGYSIADAHRTPSVIHAPYF